MAICILSERNCCWDEAKLLVIFGNDITICIDWKYDLFQIQLKALAEEMQAIIKGLEKVKQELAASENDGPVSEGFRKVFSILTFDKCTWILFNEDERKRNKNLS